MIIKEFTLFIKESNLATLAMAFVLGAASDSLIKSFVDNIFMALVDPLTGETPWQKVTLDIGPVHLKYGAFLADFLHFIILLFLVFLIVKKLFKIDKIEK